MLFRSALLFLMFIGGFVALLVVMHGEIPGGLGAAVDLARDAGKLSLTPNGWGSGGLVAALTAPYGAASVLVGASWGLIGPYGTDQLMAQRMLACSNKRQAQLAVLGSYFSVLIVGLAFLVGVGLIGYYEHTPHSGLLRLASHGSASNILYSSKFSSRAFADLFELSRELCYACKHLFAL